MADVLTHAISDNFGYVAGYGRAGAPSVEFVPGFLTSRLRRVANVSMIRL